MDTDNTTYSHSDPSPGITAAATAEPITDIETGNYGHDDNFPTIDLSNNNCEDEAALAEIILVEEEPVYGTYTRAQQAGASLIVAELVQTSVRDADLEFGNSIRNVSNENLRAEWISAKLWKDDRPLGLKLGSVSLKIIGIDDGSIISDSPFRVGDTMFSINNKECSKMGAVGSAVMLRKSVGNITIVVHNETGSSSHVECMVSKASKGEMCGIGLQRNTNYQTLVSTIRSNSKFSDSLLNSGDQVLKVNDIACASLDARAVADIINGATKTVTVLAKTSRQTGIVVAEVSTRNLSQLGVASTGQSQQPPQVVEHDGLTEGERRARPADKCCSLVILAGFAFVVLPIMASKVFAKQEEENNPDYTTYTFYDDYLDVNFETGSPSENYYDDTYYDQYNSSSWADP